MPKQISKLSCLVQFPLIFLLLPKYFATDCRSWGQYTCKSRSSDLVKGVGAGLHIEMDILVSLYLHQITGVCLDPERSKGVGVGVGTGDVTNRSLIAP